MKLDAKKVVYYGFSDDIYLIELAEECKRKEEVLVVITPVVKEYKQPLLDVMEILKEDIWIYEIQMGMKVVLKSRANKFCEMDKSARLYNE